ncbi:MAG: hypothetical protein QXX17_02130 [Conexivisphaerales archaeon]
MQPVVFLIEGEVSSSNNWREDSSGVNDPNGPTMVILGTLSYPDGTDIITVSPSGRWAYQQEGTITVSATVGSEAGSAGISGSYDVYDIVGQVNQNSPYTSFTFNQGYNDGGCDQAATYWDWGVAMYSPSSGQPSLLTHSLSIQTSMATSGKYVTGQEHATTPI